MSATSLLEKAADVFRWEYVSTECSDLCARFDEHIANLFGSESFSVLAGPTIPTGVRALPARSRVSLFRAPRVVAQVLAWHHGERLDISQLSGLVLAELVNCGLVKDVPIAVWTARGDARVSSKDGRLSTQVTPWLIEDMISVDDESPQLFPYDGSEQKLLLPLEREDAERVRNVLREALDHLAESSIPVSSFVKLFLRQVSIRIEPGAPDTFNSSSFSTYIGLALLINAHLKSVDAPNIIEALTHEAIHSMLFMIEELERPFLLERSSARIQVQSPWSGNVINLHSYIHACLVWYGLYWLWTRLIVTKILPEERCTKFRQRALAGFGHSPIEAIRQNRGDISPQVIAVLEGVQDAMNSEFSST